MASLTIPKASWQAPPNSRITSATSSKEGDRIVTGMSDGSIIIYKWKDENISPDIYCIGPPSSVTSMLCYQIELEEASGLDNALISITETGDITLWHLLDGQCLQNRQAKDEAVQGLIQGIHSSGSLVCYGECNNLVILDGATLEVINSFDLFGTWIVAASIRTTEKKDSDSMLLLDADGTIHSMTLDTTAMQCVKNAKIPSFQLPSHIMGNTIDLQINKYDNNIYFVLEKDYCQIFHCELQSLSRIKVDYDLQGAKFLSARTLLIWTARGPSFIYYLGSALDLKHYSSANIPPRCVILASNGSGAVVVDRLDIGKYDTYKEATCIGTFPTQDEMSIKLCVSSLNSQQQSIIAFSTNNLQSVEIRLTNFWASLFGSNMTTNILGDDKQTLTLQFDISKTINMSQVWHIGKKQVQYTTMVALLKKYIAVGFADGTIAIVPQTTILTEDQNYWMKTAVRILIGHNNSISCLFVPDFAQLSTKNILLSGDSGGKVIMWNSLTGQTLGCFYNHSQSVTGFVQVPHEVGGKYKTSALSIAQDNSVGLIQLEEKTSVAFVGHKNRICAVYWRTIDHYLMMIHCIDGSLHIWHMKSGNLDRVVRDWSVDEIIATNIAKVSYVDLKLASLHRIAFFILETQYPLHVSLKAQKKVLVINLDTTPIVAVALINVKKLIDEMYNGEQMPNSQDTSPTGSITGSPAFERAKLTPGPTEKHHNPIQYLQKKLTQSHPKQEASKAETPTGISDTPRGSRPDHILASNLFACIMSWGIDTELDNICSRELKLSKPHQLTIGIRGAGGYLSFPVPKPPTSPQLDWTYSPNLSAQRLLTIIALLRSLVTNYNLSLDLPKLIRQFGSIVDYSSTLVPSFSFLIKFWQDAISDVQEATRFIVSSLLINASEDKIQSIVNYWGKFMPLKAPIQSKTGCRATIILALMGSILPPALPLRITKDVATSLEAIIRDPGKNPYRLLAIEIIGSGFQSWEPHLNGSSVIRCLVQLTGLTGQQNVQGAPLITPPSMIMARQALLSIANYNTGLFISTLTFDLLHAKDIWERVGGLKLLGLFIAKKPVLLFNHLQPMVEAMVKMLDPNHPSIRESLQDIVTVNFADLVKIFPSIAFHPGSQRLAVGTVDGSSIIFDLRTATKLNLLEGIKSQAHGISFSPNGKLIATLHLHSNQISFWQPSSGFLESLAGVFSGAQHPKQIGMQLPLGVSRVSAFRTFPLGAPNPDIDTKHVLESVRFEWTGERSVRLISINGLELAFNV
ncbi:hypothetical protein HDV06_002861 [Boothiomyces sp. JEL0866]|nr:hypothetical protein HDV06_002861 [Boothiomyces sp. JEL0866]